MFKPVMVRHYLEVMKALGYGAEAVLQDTGISEEALSSRDFLIDMNQSRSIVSNMITLTGDQGIGLEIGSQTRAVDLGLVGYLAMSAKTNREAVRYWINYSNALVGMPLRLRLEESAADDWAIVIEEFQGVGFIYNFCVEEQLMLICRISAELSETTPLMKLLELSYPAPAHHALYRRHFNGPIKFNSPRTRIAFSAPRLDQPLRGNDPEFNELCERQCEALLRKIGQWSPLIGKIRNLLVRAPGEVPAIEEVARELSISPRTLRRHLQKEGFTYQQLLNEFRAGMAKEYLHAVGMSAKEVAYVLGFKDTNSFRRAFKIWTGKTVQEFRGENPMSNQRSAIH